MLKIGYLWIVVQILLFSSKWVFMLEDVALLRRSCITSMIHFSRYYFSMLVHVVSCVMQIDVVLCYYVLLCSSCAIFVYITLCKQTLE